ncbi:MAG: hypothetical protein HY075_05590 [Deltaproteobacteria bacterium]|nr:hypothetical protein [Deltaproteobacteria bacterium]
MKRSVYLKLSAVLVCVLALAGCDSPAASLSTIAKALGAGDFKTFSAKLDGAAFARYGNAAAFAELRAKLAPYQLKAGTSYYVRTDCYQTQFECRDHLITHWIRILAAPAGEKKPKYVELNAATVQCIEVDHGVAQIESSCFVTAFDHDF